MSNITPRIWDKVGAHLHLRPYHPLNLIKQRIQLHFERNGPSMTVFDDLSPIVSTTDCFDSLLVPPSHVSRSPSDTFYLSGEHTQCLRTHTSAHQTPLLSAGHDQFLVFGDCYRRDEIDRTHYPVFHQVEGVRVFPDTGMDKEEVMKDLRHTLEGLAASVFGRERQRGMSTRWVDEYFPFTEPSLELEVGFGKGEGEGDQDWMELLGCGAIRGEILRGAGRGEGVEGWAFGIGLERVAMAVYGIPDIRLFWSDDERFLSQFEGVGAEDEVRFEEYSRYPPCFKDVSMWEGEGFRENDVFCGIREIAGDLVEGVELVDSFVHPKTGRKSRCYRITYRSMDRSLTNMEVDELQGRVRGLLSSQLGLELR